MDNENQQQLSPTTTVGEIRKQHGPNFAPGYGDQDPIGEVFGRAGVTTLDEYLAQNRKG